MIDKGEVIILDSGNYGNGGPPLVISQNVTIKTPAGVLATMSSNQQDVVQIVQPAANTPISVTMIGFQLNGLSANTRSGIYIDNPGGGVNLYSNVVTNVPAAGVYIAAGGFGIANCILNNNATGLQLGNLGSIGVVEGGSVSDNTVGISATDLADVRIHDVSIEGNSQYGILVNANSTPGANGSKILVSGSRLNFNGLAGVSLTEACSTCTSGAGGPAAMTLDNSTISAVLIGTSNIDGVYVSGNAALKLSGNVITSAGSGHPLNIANSPNSASAAITSQGFLPLIVTSSNNVMQHVGSASAPILFQSAGGAPAECTPSSATPCGISPETRY